MSLKSRGRDESLIICEMKQYIYTYYRSFLHWLVLLSLSQISSPHHGVPHDHSVHLRHELTYRSEKNFVWFICTDHDPAPKITSHGGAWCLYTVHTWSFMLCCQPLLYFVLKYCVLMLGRVQYQYLIIFLLKDLKVFELLIAS